MEYISEQSAGRGILVLISAPSGGGKNAVITELLRLFDGATQLVTTTTRPPRDGERHGMDYYFIPRGEFLKKIEAGEFLEYNEYATNYYGTEKGELERRAAEYRVVFSQAEVHGKQSLDRLGVPHISVFLLPESMDVLEDRLRKRGGMDEKQMAVRLSIAKQEIAAAASYDLQIVNREGDMAETVRRITAYLEERGIRRSP